MTTFTRICTALLCLFCISCQKKVTDPTEANNQKAAEFRTFLTQGGTFRLVDYYAESPVDYDETDDTITLETDLKGYIRFYLLDDDIIFNSNGTVTFVQHDQKISNDSSEEIIVPFQTRGDKAGVVVDYASDQYEPLTYYLHEQGSTYFILSWKRPVDGVRLFSRFDMVL